MFRSAFAVVALPLLLTVSSLLLQPGRGSRLGSPAHLTLEDSDEAVQKLDVAATSVEGCTGKWVKHKLTSDLHLCLKDASVSVPKASLFHQLADLYDRYVDLKIDSALECRECRTERASSNREIDVLRAERDECGRRWNETFSSSLVCPDDSWVQYKTKCYKLYSRGSLSYPRAKQACRQLHPKATLPTIHSAEEQDHLVRLILNVWKVKFPDHGDGVGNGVWLDMLYIGQTFFWADGSPVIYTNWAPSEPSDSGSVEHYVQLCLSLLNYNAGTKLYAKWNDVSHERSQVAVCETYGTNYLA